MCRGELTLSSCFNRANKHALCLHVLTDQTKKTCSICSPLSQAVGRRPAETCDYSIAGIQRLDLNHYYLFVTTWFFATTVLMEGLHREHIQTPRSAK
jgi:hypothetical protein